MTDQPPDDHEHTAIVYEGGAEVPTFCPHCGDELCDEDPRHRLFECPTHGRLILSVITLD